MSTFQLSIKSLEQQVKHISLPRNSSVLELKQKIKLVFNVDTLRQRLIFQGKVLKDDKNLLDYENLDNGKVVHLVVRPLHAPRHPGNDEPRQTEETRPGGHFSFLSNFMSDFPATLPMLIPEDYASIGRSSLLPEIFPAGSRNLSSNDLFRQERQLEGLSGTTDSNRQPPVTLPIPSSLDMRLSRTLCYIREARFIMNSRLLTHQIRTISFASIHESRQILRQYPNHSSQISFVLQELTDLYDQCIPYLRSVSQSLTQPAQHQQIESVLRTARLVQTLSLCHHFVSSILSSVQIDNPSNENWVPSPEQDQNSTQIPQPQQQQQASTSSTSSGTKRKRELDDKDNEGPSSKK